MVKQLAKNPDTYIFLRKSGYKDEDIPEWAARPPPDMIEELNEELARPANQTLQEGQSEEGEENHEDLESDAPKAEISTPKSAGSADSAGAVQNNPPARAVPQLVGLPAVRTCTCGPAVRTRTERTPHLRGLPGGCRRSTHPTTAQRGSTLHRSGGCSGHGAGLLSADPADHDEGKRSTRGHALGENWNCRWGSLHPSLPHLYVLFFIREDPFDPGDVLVWVVREPRGRPIGCIGPRVAKGK